MLQKLKNRWNVQSGWQVLIILLVFACTGFSVMYLKKTIVAWLKIENKWILWVINIFIILPLYQLILLAYGWVFGQFDFFWNFEKRMFKRIVKLWEKS